MSLEIFCRVRLYHAEQTLDPKAETKNRNKSHSPILNQLTSLIVATSNTKHYLLALLQKPVKQNLVNEYIKTDQDIQKYENTLLSNSEIFKMDQVFNSNTKQRVIYQELMQAKIRDQQSHTFIFTGPETSINKYNQTNDHEKDLLQYAVVDSLKQISFHNQQQNNQNQQKLVVKIFAVDGNQIYDLLPNYDSTSANEMIINEPKEINIILNNSKNLDHSLDKFIIFQFRQQDLTIRTLNFITLSQQSLPFLHLRHPYQYNIQKHLVNYIQKSKTINILLCLKNLATTQFQATETYQFIKAVIEIKEKWKDNYNNMLQYLDQDNAYNLMDEIFQYQKITNSFSLDQKLVWIADKSEKCQQMCLLIEQKHIKTPEESFVQKSKINKLRDAQKYLGDLNSQLIMQEPFNNKKIQMSITSIKRENPVQNNKIHSKRSLNNSQNRSRSNIRDLNDTQDNDYKEQENKLQYKILGKNEEIAKLKEENIQFHMVLLEEKKIHMIEKNDLERQIQQLKEQISEERQNTQRIQAQMERIGSQFQISSKVKEHLDHNQSTFERIQNQLGQELFDANNKIAELKLVIQNKDNKILNQDEIIQNLKQKLSKLKQKIDDQKKNTLDQQISEAQKRKNKNEDLRQTIIELEQRQDGLAQEIKIFKNETERLKQENSKLKETVDSKQSDYNQSKKIQLEREDLEYQLEKMDQIIRGQSQRIEQDQQDMVVLDQRLNLRDIELQKIESAYSKLKEDNHLISNELRNYKDLVDKMEKQNQLISDVQISDFDTLESKVEKISKEIIYQKEENAYLRKNEKTMKQELDTCYENSDLMAINLQELKRENKLLKQQLDELDRTLRQILAEKHTEVNQQLKKSSLSSHHSVGNQLKSLENLENLIKYSRQKRDSSSDDSSSSN